jgi:hypothetical protein
VRPLRAALIAALTTATLSAAPALAAPPSVVVSGPSSAQTGDPVSFDASASSDPDGQALTFSWAIDGEQLSVAQDWLSVAFAHPGTHVISLTVTDAGGMSASVDRRVTITGDDQDVGSLRPLSPALPSVVAVPDLVLRPTSVRGRLQRGRLRVEVRCRGAAVCAGTVRAVAVLGRELERPLLLTQRRFRVTRGGPRILHLRLGARALRRLRHHRRVRVTAYRGRVQATSLWATYAFRVPRAALG